MAARKVFSFPCGDFFCVGFGFAFGHAEDAVICFHDASKRFWLVGTALDAERGDAGGTKGWEVWQHGERTAVQDVHMAELVTDNGKIDVLAITQSVMPTDAGHGATGHASLPCFRGFTIARRSQEAAERAIFGNHELQGAVYDAFERQRRDGGEGFDVFQGELWGERDGRDALVGEERERFAVRGEEGCVRMNGKVSLLRELQRADILDVDRRRGERLRNIEDIKQLRQVFVANDARRVECDGRMRFAGKRGGLFILFWR